MDRRSSLRLINSTQAPVVRIRSDTSQIVHSTWHSQEVGWMQFSMDRTEFKALTITSMRFSFHRIAVQRRRRKLDIRVLLFPEDSRHRLDQSSIRRRSA